MQPNPRPGSRVHMQVRATRELPGPHRSTDERKCAGPPRAARPKPRHASGWLAGVLQGCPLSGMLFDIAIDPLLCMFEDTIQTVKKAEFGVCADDVGAAIASYRHLPLLHPCSLHGNVL